MQLIPLLTKETAVLNVIASSSLADSTKAKYGRVIEDYLEDGNKLTDVGHLRAYASQLSNSRKAHLKAAVKLWSNAMIDHVKSIATPDNLAAVDASIHRFQALQTAVTVKTAKGEKLHVWLSRPQVQQLLDATGNNARDRLALSLLVGAGLRRDEAVNLRFDHVVMQPTNGRMRTVLQVTGKGAKDRAIPISEKLAALIDSWTAVSGGNGLVLRSVSKGGELGGSLSSVALFQIVRRYGRQIGKPKLAPHDLRRSYAQIGYEAGVPVTQISRLLGHSSIATTQRYLNLELDLETTVSDFVPL